MIFVEPGVCRTTGREARSQAHGFDCRAVGDHRTVDSTRVVSRQWQGSATTKRTGNSQRHTLDITNRRTVAGLAGSVSAIPNVPSSISGMESSGAITDHFAGAGRGLKKRGGIDLEECFIDGAFTGAKKGASKSEKPSGARARRSWQS